jgi:hypothetical protein
VGHRSVDGLTADKVAASLGLGSEYQAWLDSLEATDSPPDRLALLSRDVAAELLRRLGVIEPDLSEILTELSSANAQPEQWWLLERSVHGVLLDIGLPEAIRPMPNLPEGFGPQGRCFWIFVYLAAVAEVRRWHHDHGVSDAVSWATLADLGRHISLHRRRKGCVGLDTQWWLSLHLRGALFELGRLQFNPYRLLSGPAGPLFWYDAETMAQLGEGFRSGDAVLGVHIPASGPLLPAECDASFEQAGQFFAKLFPEAASRVVTCTSWLLDDQLLEYLAPGSNIVHFQKRFELVPGTYESDSSPFQFVFNREPNAMADMTPRTTLERALVAHLAAGRHWHLRTGWLRL